jgi:hypothetical protein
MNALTSVLFAILRHAAAMAMAVRVMVTMAIMTVAATAAVSVCGQRNLLRKTLQNSFGRLEESPPQDSL